MSKQSSRSPGRIAIVFAVVGVVAGGIGTVIHLRARTIAEVAPIVSTVMPPTRTNIAPASNTPITVRSNSPDPRSIDGLPEIGGQ